MNKDKDELYWKILRSALALDTRQGHLKWTMTQLARKSEVKRPLIYYYFGNSKIGIVMEALRLLRESFGLIQGNQNHWTVRGMLDSFAKSRKFFEECPEIAMFYYRNREVPGEIGDVIRGCEAVMERKVSETFRDLGPEEAKALRALYFGFAFTRDLSAESLEFGIIQLTKGLSIRQKVPEGLSGLLAS